jgi:hypothetical protein
MVKPNREDLSASVLNSEKFSDNRLIAGGRTSDINRPARELLPIDM